MHTTYDDQTPAAADGSQVAERLQVSEPTVRRILERGEVPAFQLGPPGSSVRVDVGALDAWLQGCDDDPAGSLKMATSSRSLGGALPGGREAYQWQYRVFQIMPVPRLPIAAARAALAV